MLSIGRISVRFLDVVFMGWKFKVAVCVFFIILINKQEVLVITNRKD